MLALLAFAVLLAACGPESGATSDEVDKEAEALRIAAAFGQSGDVSRARIDLQSIEVANPSHWLIFLTERYISTGESPGETQALVQLTVGLGLQSRTVTEYAQQHNLLPAAPEREIPVAQPSESNVIALQPAPRESAPGESAQGESALSESALSEESAEIDAADEAGESDASAAGPVSAQAEAQTETQPDPEPAAEAPPAPPTTPRVQATNDLNVRGGPGINYSVVGALQNGAQADIIAKNPQSDWWQVSLTGGQQGWVYGPLVTTSGDTSGIAVAVNIPAPPPTPVPAPVADAPPVQEEAAPPPAAEPEPEPGPEPEQPVEEAPPAEGWSVHTRLRPVGQDAQNCAGGAHDIFVTVVDAGGNPLNGVRVKEIFTGQVKETGGSGPGRIHWNIYRGGGGQVQLVDEGGNAISPQSEGMSADWPAFHMMWDAGYCDCKPHPDAASCEADLNNRAYLFAVGHYTYEVTFQRNY